MAPTIDPVSTSRDMPDSTTVVIIGGGIVGLVAALTLAERGVPVVVLEKGRVAGEQSSRNLGWIRKMGRETHDLPLSFASEQLWEGMAERVGADVGYRKAGILYVSRTQEELAGHRKWLAATQSSGLDSRLMTPQDIDAMVPGGTGGWAGGIYTPSDGRAEPTIAASAIARAALAKGAVIIENCAVRTLALADGHVRGVVTERGEIRCERVLLAGGLWSRRFLGNIGVALPTLPLVASVLRTAPMVGPTEIAVGGPDFSFRKRLDGGYTITQRGAFVVPILLDNLLIGRHFLPTLRAQWKSVRLSFGRAFLADIASRRRWKAGQTSPFEQVRTMDPPVNALLNAEAMANLSEAWPVFRDAHVEQTWAGMIDVTPDSLPVISSVVQVPGLVLASGFSGHGFGTAPGAGQLAADLLMGDAELVDPTPYRLDRFNT